METCVVNIKSKKHFYKTNDNWKTFEEIKNIKEDGISENISAASRFVKLGESKYVFTTNFWINYKKVQTIDTSYHDDSKNKVVLQRYCISDNEVILTDDF